MNARDRLRIMIRSDRGSMTVWSEPEIDDAFAAYDVEHRAEVLAEADLLPKADVVAWLVKKTREETPVWLLASKVERGAIRPDNLRMLPPNFFEPGTTYRNGLYTFHCHGIGPHPTTGETRAVGWLTHTDRQAPEVWDMDPDDWAAEQGGWANATTNTTEAGQ